MTTSLGRRIRKFRGNILTQQELANRSGVSVDFIRKLEQEQRNTASVNTLHRIARALDVPLAYLVGSTALPERAGKQDITALRYAITNIGDLIGYPDSEAMTVRDAQRTETYAWGVYWSGDHESAVSILPTFITQLRGALSAANIDDKKPIALALAQVLWISGCTLTHLRHPDTAYIATREAAGLTEHGDDPYLTATAHGSLAWQLMVNGRYDESMKISTLKAKEIQPGKNATVSELSAYGSLVLQAGNAAARAGNKQQATELLGTSSETCQRVPDGRNDYGTSFGPSQLAMQTADIMINLGEFDRALSEAQQMPNGATALPTMARCRHMADKALAHLKTGDHEKALNLVATAEQTSPRWAKHQALPKAVVRDLLRNSRKRSDRLTTLAARLGVR